MVKILRFKRVPYAKPRKSRGACNNRTRDPCGVINDLLKPTFKIYVCIFVAVIRSREESRVRQWLILYVVKTIPRTIVTCKTWILHWKIFCRDRVTLFQKCTRNRRRCLKKDTELVSKKGTKFWNRFRGILLRS